MRHVAGPFLKTNTGEGRQLRANQYAHGHIHVPGCAYSDDVISDLLLLLSLDRITRVI